MTRILLITSTIEPDANVHALKRVNTLERLNDYQTAFDFYCQRLKDNTFDIISYVDNSGHDLSSLAAIANRHGVGTRVEFISYRSTVSPNNNRLFLELNLIEHFYKTSRSWANEKEAIVWKVTGRYLIRNIRNITEKSKALGPKKIYINLRNYPYKVVDFYLVGFTRQGYTELFANQLDRYEGLTDGELVLRQFIDDRHSHSNDVSLRLPVTPRILGVRGYDGGRYGGVKDTIKYQVRAFANKIVPHIWI